MLNQLKEDWKKVTEFFDGLKTKLTAVALFILNFWDAVAPAFDFQQLISDSKIRAAVSAVLAVLIYFFRGLANKTQEAKDELDK